MSLNLLTKFQLNKEILSLINADTTDFAKVDGKEYDGFAIYGEGADAFPELKIFTNGGRINDFDENNPSIGIRPWIKFSKIKHLCKVISYEENGCMIVEFAEYPQQKVLEQVEITGLFIANKLKKTGKVYRYYNNEETPKIISCEEFVDDNDSKYVLKNGVWYTVSPVRWVVNEKSDVALSQYMISGGVPFYSEKLVKEEKNYVDILDRRLFMKNPLNTDYNPYELEGFLELVLSKDLLNRMGNALIFDPYYFDFTIPSRLPSNLRTPLVDIDSLPVGYKLNRKGNAVIPDPYYSGFTIPSRLPSNLRTPLVDIDSLPVGYKLNRKGNAVIPDPYYSGSTIPSRLPNNLRTPLVDIDSLPIIEATDVADISLDVLVDFLVDDGNSADIILKSIENKLLELYNYLTNENISYFAETKYMHPILRAEYETKLIELRKIVYEFIEKLIQAGLLDADSVKNLNCYTRNRTI